LILSYSLCTTANAQDYEFNHLASTLISNSYNSLNFDAAQNHYFFTGYGVECMDLNNPSNPQVVSVIVTPGQSYEGAYLIAQSGLDDGFLIADGDVGVTFVDVWDPDSMYVKVTLDVGGICRNVAVQDEDSTYVCCAVDGVGIIVVNVEDNANPFVMGAYPDAEITIHDLEFFGDYLYVAADDSLSLMDVSDPANPQFFSSWSYPGISILGMDYHPAQDSLYLALGAPGVITLDMNDLANPAITGGLISTNGPALGVATYIFNYVGTYYYYFVVAEGDAGFEIYWCQIPGSPTSIQATVGSCNSVLTNGLAAYFAEGAKGFEIWDVAAAYSPEFVTHHEESGGARSAERSGNYAYVANYSAGMTVLDLTDMANPDSLTSVTIDSLCFDVIAVWPYVYALDFGGEWRVFDVTNPASPTTVYTVIGPEGYRSMDVWNGYLYMGIYFGAGVQIYDVDTNPAVPLYLGLMPAPQPDTDIEDVEAADGLLYLAALNQGVYIYDLADPANPALLSNYQTTGTTHMVEVDGSTAYIAAGSEGVLVLDATDPANPALLSTIFVGSDVSGVTYDDGILLVAHAESGVSAYDVTDPSSPVWLTSHDSPGQACEVVAWDAWHALLCDTYSLEIFEVESDPQPVISLSASQLDFGSVPVGEQVDLPLTIYNVGSEILILYEVVTGDPVFGTDFNPSDSLITPGDSLVLTVSFAPDEAVYYSNNLTIENNDASVDVALLGEGLVGIAVTILPLNPPIIIPQTGGSFDFNVAVVNNQLPPATFDAWIMVTLPNGMQFGPVLGPVNLTLPGGESINRDRTQSVPGGAPPGTYTYSAYVGDYPIEIWDQDSFTFEKLASGTGAVVSDWVSFGESFDPWLSDITEEIPDDFALQAAFPNPFNPVTRLSFALPEALQVNLSVFDISGRRVVTLIDGWTDAGVHEVTFDASGLASGIYIYRFQAGVFNASGKMVMMK
jgi:hypothetical protein